jgi:hypothetical protein
MRAPARGPVARKDLQAFLELGVSLVAATRDERGVVELVRCGAAALDQHGRVHVAVPLPEGARALLDIDHTGVIALSAALPIDYRTVQFKGSDARRADWPELARAVAQHRTRFVAGLLAIGLPEAYAMHLWSSECVGVVFTASELFDQTPGPHAGLSLAP